MGTSGSIHRDKVAMKQTSPFHPEQRLRMGEVSLPLPHTTSSQKTSDSFTFVNCLLCGAVPNVMRLPLMGSALILFSMGPSLDSEFLYNTQYLDHPNTRIYAVFNFVYFYLLLCTSKIYHSITTITAL
jgi:hypothetical protein